MPAGSNTGRDSAMPPLGDRLNDAVKDHLRDAAVVRSMMNLLDRAGCRPIVVDANRLRGEIRALAQSGHDTALVTLARTGFMRLFTAGHVLREVDTYREKWAHEAWMSVLRPLTNEVSFSRDLLTPDELARIEILDQPQPLGDPDDVPTAIAAMVLGAPLLSGDYAPLTAVYGPGVDMKQHDAYLNALFGGGRALVVSQWGHVAMMLARLFGGLGTSGIRALAARTGAVPLLMGAVGAVLIAASSERTRALLVRSIDPLHAAGTAMLEVYAFYRDAEADYGQLAAPLLQDLDALAPRVAVAREAARRSVLELAATATVVPAADA